MDQIISVAVPRPVDGLFTYRISEPLAAEVRIGGCVRVPFGRVSLDAFVVERPKPVSEISHDLDPASLKEVQEVVKEVSPLPTDVLDLCRWAHEYYFAPLGEVMACACPLVQSQIRKLKRPPKSIVFNGSITRKVQLTSEQVAVLELFDGLRQSQEPKVGLLHGVTGSGKTEVYIELARKVLEAGKSVLVLLPEIALTPQLHQRFEQSLGVAVGLWHSAMAATRRRDLNQALLNGQVRVVVGARSSVFAPLKELGLIVVDEEHDSTYKQEDRVRYHARDLAVVRGKLTRSLVVLGSATPSLETLERVREGRYALGELKHRVNQMGMPSIELIDLKCEEKIEGVQAPLAHRTLAKIQETLDSGQQVVVYLNRRGFAAYLLCKDCGKVSECHNCSISLTVHRFRRQLKCHHCGFTQPIPLQCSGCQGMNLQSMGAGTESLEEDLPRILTGAKVARLDRDLVTSAARLGEILEGFRRGESNLLLGTQMLVKGHDFPNVTLVVVILADSLFRWPDFRAPERAFQILKQVSGRAGRGERSGVVYIQAYDVDHPVLRTVSAQESEVSFFETERDLRQALHYPPFGRIARLRVEGPIQSDVMKDSMRLADLMRQGLGGLAGFELLGPSEAFLEKSHGIFRWDLLVKCKDIQVLQKALRYSKQLGRDLKSRIQLDVDPYSV